MLIGGFIALIIYPDKDYSKLLAYQGRQCGKTNIFIAILEAIMSSKLHNKPVEVSFGMKLIKIED